jgi:hypothetical protein
VSPAEWTLGAALSEMIGRKSDSRAMLERAAEHAPGTWMTTPVTR